MNLTKSVINGKDTTAAAQDTARSDFKGATLANDTELRTYQGGERAKLRLEQHKQSSTTQLLFPPIQNIAAAEAAAFKSTLAPELTQKGQHRRYLSQKRGSMVNAETTTGGLHSFGGESARPYWQAQLQNKLNTTQNAS